MERPVEQDFLRQAQISKGDFEKRCAGDFDCIKIASTSLLKIAFRNLSLPQKTVGMNVGALMFL
jgi:hypothetical protein